MLQTNTEIAQNIRALAKSRGVTVKQTLADCKINRNFIYDLEHGNSSPSVDKISRIADYFGVGTAALLGGDAADGAENRGAVAEFLDLYGRLSPEDKAALRDYMRKLLESGD